MAFYQPSQRHSIESFIVIGSMAFVLIRYGSSLINWLLEICYKYFIERPL